MGQILTIKDIAKQVAKEAMNSLEVNDMPLEEFIVKVDGVAEFLKSELRICSDRFAEEPSPYYDGVDVGFTNEEHSWAVICVAGKPEYVKFLPLNGEDTRRVIDFLKQFQYSRHIIDSPLAFRNMVRDRIL